MLVTARSGNEIARVELWANGQLQENRAASQEGLTTFSTAFVWQPQRPGAYTLIARAFDARGNAGQATVAVRVVDNLPPDEPPVPPPSEGEGTPGHSEDPGGTEAEPGEEESPPGEEETPPEAEAPPEEGAPDPDPVGPADEVVEVGAEEGGQVMLTLEALGLLADTDYHSINCYVTVADAETEQVVFGQGMWMFPWEPTETISATFPWPSDQPLPVRVECTGVSPPAEAIPLGEPAEGEAPPETWDGRFLELEWPGAYRFFYRVQFGVGVTSEEIPAPTNLRIEDVPLSTLKMLRWDWAGDEAQIEGFRLYLNGSLQWRVADPSARFTYLPPEWTDPPCGQYFSFQVTAYQGPFPGGVESFPGAMAPLEPEPGRCGGIYRITFEEIQFAGLDYPVDLPDVADGDGKAGPLYGWFWVNDMLLPFDTVQSDGISVAGIRVEGGEHFDMAATLYGEPYRYRQNSVVFQWDNEWGGFGLGGITLDYDWGETDDQDDLVCSGGLGDPGPPPAPFAGMFQCLAADGVTDVAHVTYSIEELPEWPEGGPPPGAIPGAPRPELFVPGWELGPFGELAIPVFNVGRAAAVPDLDLAVELDGVVLGDYTIPSGPDPMAGEWDGWFSMFILPDHTFVSLADLCTLQVTVDPANYYLEYAEFNNTTTAADLDTVWFIQVFRLDTVSAVLETEARYFSCHDDPVGVRAVPLVGGVEAADFTVETVAVSYGSTWPVVINVLYTGADPLTTDGWRLEMIDLVTSEVFFSDEVEDTQEWTP